ncbi:MAG: serine hydrolase [Thermosynechococcaceae cyanobacterium]
MFFKSDRDLVTHGQQVLEATWDKFPELSRNQIALTWLVYDPPFPTNTGGALDAQTFWQYPVRGFSYRGMERIYPASVVKLFYLVACHEWLETGMLQPSSELDRAMQDMIADSSNDATGLVVDMLTGTTSGPELPPEPFETWKYQRNLVNRYLQSLSWSELDTINVNQKTWGDGPYGREKVFVGHQNRNILTTDAVARLLHSLVGGVAVSGVRSQQMMSVMQRSLNPEELAANPENQISGFLGEALPQEAQIWSKAGWTSTVRHDAAYIELPNTHPCTLVVFIDNPTLSQNKEILPFISQKALDAVPLRS